MRPTGTQTIGVSESKLPGLHVLFHWNCKSTWPGTIISHLTKSRPGVREDRLIANYTPTMFYSNDGHFHDLTIA